MLRTALLWAFTATLTLCLADSAFAGPKEDAARYTKDLSSKDTKVKIRALQELAKIGQIQKSLIKEAEPKMLAELEAKEPMIRAAAAKAIGMIDPDPKVVIPKLTKMLADDKEEDVQVAAADGLGAMGRAAKPANKTLRDVMKDHDDMSKVYRAIQNALRSINP